MPSSSRRAPRRCGSTLPPACSTPWRVWLWTPGYGSGLAGPDLFFYLAMRTLPLGLTVAVEFPGPLSLAILASRRRVDILWAALAAAGMTCLLRVFHGGPNLDPTGLGFALPSAMSWVICIRCGHRVGRDGRGGRAVVLGVSVAAVAVLPFGIAQAGFDLLPAEVLPLAWAVALVSGCVPMGSKWWP